MPDYYSFLWQALKQGDVDDPRWRETVFQRTRRMLLDRLLAERPPLTKAEIRLNADALEAAIATVRSELRRRDAGAAVRAKIEPGYTEEIAVDEETAAGEDIVADAEPLRTDDAGLRRPPFRLKRIGWVAVAIAVAAVAGAAYMFFATQHGDRTSSAAKTHAANDRVTTLRPAKRLRRAPADGDLPPGVDGGSSESDVPFVFHRQPVFYRTTQPAGTVIIDKQQHFLYLIQPNLVALRYGIGVGKQCADLTGLRHVSSKVEWPQWEAPADMVERKLAPPGMMPGGPGNPLGARLIGLDDGSSRIHGTNAPKTIGTSVSSGCIRLVNDDVVDLYNRLSVGDRVILSD